MIALDEAPLTQMLQCLWRGKAVVSQRYSNNSSGKVPMGKDLPEDGLPGIASVPVLEDISFINEVPVNLRIPPTVVFEHNFPKGLYFADPATQRMSRRVGRDVDSSICFEALMNVEETFGWGNSPSADKKGGPNQEKADRDGKYVNGKGPARRFGEPSAHLIKLAAAQEAKLPGKHAHARDSEADIVAMFVEIDSDGTLEGGTATTTGTTAPSGPPLNHKQSSAKPLDGDQRPIVRTHYLTEAGLRLFLLSSSPQNAVARNSPQMVDAFTTNNKHGILQRFIYPVGKHNELIQVLWTPQMFFVEKCQTKAVLGDIHLTPFQRAATFEAPENYTSKVFVSPSIYEQLRSSCDNLIANIASIEKRAVTNAVLFFKVDEHGVLWFLFVSQINFVQPLAKGVSTVATSDIKKAEDVTGLIPVFAMPASIDPSKFLKPIVLRDFPLVPVATNDRFSQKHPSKSMISNTTASAASPHTSRRHPAVPTDMTHPAPSYRMIKGGMFTSMGEDEVLRFGRDLRVGFVGAGVDLAVTTAAAIHQRPTTSGANEMRMLDNSSNSPGKRAQARTPQHQSKYSHRLMPLQAPPPGSILTHYYYEEKDSTFSHSYTNDSANVSYNESGKGSFVMPNGSRLFKKPSQYLRSRSNTLHDAKPKLPITFGGETALDRALQEHASRAAAAANANSNALERQRAQQPAPQPEPVTLVEESTPAKHRRKRSMRDLEELLIAEVEGTGGGAQQYLLAMARTDAMGLSPIHRRQVGDNESMVTPTDDQGPRFGLVAKAEAVAGKRALLRMARGVNSNLSGDMPRACEGCVYLLSAFPEEVTALLTSQHAGEAKLLIEQCCEAMVLSEESFLRAKLTEAETPAARLCWYINRWYAARRSTLGAAAFALALIEAAHREGKLAGVKAAQPPIGSLLVFSTPCHPLANCATSSSTTELKRLAEYYMSLLLPHTGTRKENGSSPLVNSLPIEATDSWGDVITDRCIAGALLEFIERCASSSSQGSREAIKLSLREAIAIDEAKAGGGGWAMDLTTFYRMWGSVTKATYRESPSLKLQCYAISDPIAFAFTMQAQLSEFLTVSLRAALDRADEEMGVEVFEASTTVPWDRPMALAVNDEPLSTPPSASKSAPIERTASESVARDTAAKEVVEGATEAATITMLSHCPHTPPQEAIAKETATVVSEAAANASAAERERLLLSAETSPLT